MCDDDKFGSLEVWKFGSLKVCVLCVMMISLEVWKFGSLEVYILCVMIISLELWKFGSLHVVCHDDKL